MLSKMTLESGKEKFQKVGPGCLDLQVGTGRAGFGCAQVDGASLPLWLVPVWELGVVSWACLVDSQCLGRRHWFQRQQTQGPSFEGSILLPRK